MHIEGRVTNIQKQALSFFAQKLFTPQLKRNIIVRVIFRKDLRDETGQIAYGFAQVEARNTHGRPRYFIIEVNADIDSDQKLQTLAHEMIHVKQFAHGELNEDMTLWRGRAVDSNKIPYVEHPWEIEANAKGDKIYKAFVADTLE